MTGQAIGVRAKERAEARYFLVALCVFLALMLISGLAPTLRKLGFYRLPGDLHFKLFGREFYVPLTTTLILSLLASLVAKYL